MRLFSRKRKKQTEVSILPSFEVRSHPCESPSGVFCPAGPLTCPKCGSVKKYGDMEGACGCENGHSWWDTNSPEYVEMRRRLRERNT